MTKHTSEADTLGQSPGSEVLNSCASRVYSCHTETSILQYGYPSKPLWTECTLYASVNISLLLQQHNLGSK